MTEIKLICARVHTHSYCSGSQGSTWHLGGSASSSCGRKHSERGPAGGCGSSCPRYTPCHCCMDTPAEEKNISNNRTCIAKEHIHFKTFINGLNFSFGSFCVADKAFELPICITNWCSRRGKLDKQWPVSNKKKTRVVSQFRNLFPNLESIQPVGVSFTCHNFIQNAFLIYCRKKSEYLEEIYKSTQKGPS